MAWKVKEPCDECPFSQHPKGKNLAYSLGEERMAEIKDSTIIGQVFHCHKTYFKNPTNEKGEFTTSGKELECAGAIEYRQTPEAIAEIPFAFGRLMQRIQKEREEVDG